MAKPLSSTASRRQAVIQRVRWIGPTEGPELGLCYQSVVASSAELVQVGGPADLTADLTVVACPRQIVAVEPIAKLAEEGECVQLLGVWCEGEGRTGRVVPGVERVFWHAWPAWWRLRTQKSLDAVQIPAPVWIQTSDAALADSLLDALAEESIPAVWAPADRLRVGPFSAIVWDGAQLGGREADRLAATCQAARRAKSPVLALLDFPRPETVAASMALGAAAVLGKPFERAELLETLRYAIGESKHAAMKAIHANPVAKIDLALIAHAA